MRPSGLSSEQSTTELNRLSSCHAPLAAWLQRFHFNRVCVFFFPNFFFSLSSGFGFVSALLRFQWPVAVLLCREFFRIFPFWFFGAFWCFLVPKGGWLQICGRTPASPCLTWLRWSKQRREVLYQRACCNHKQQSRRTSHRSPFFLSLWMAEAA